MIKHNATSFLPPYSGRVGVGLILLLLFISCSDDLFDNDSSDGLNGMQLNLSTIDTTFDTASTLKTSADNKRIILQQITMKCR